MLRNIFQQNFVILVQWKQLSQNGTFPAKRNVIYIVYVWQSRHTNRNFYQKMHQNKIIQYADKTHLHSKSYILTL